MIFYIVGIYFIFSITSLVIFDELLKIQFNDSEELWKELGSSIGFFWSPPEGKTFSGSFARNKLSFSLLFNTPFWIKENSKSLILLKFYRICGFISFLILLSICLLLAFYS